MRRLIRFWVERLSHPIRGLIYAFRHDFAVQFEIIAGIIVLTGLHLLFGPFSAIETLLFLFSWFFVVVNELQNSALEIALDQIHPEHHEEIGRSKDLASAAVVWAAVFGVICVVFVVAGKL